jgi:hypothetical protein
MVETELPNIHVPYKLLSIVLGGHWVMNTYDSFSRQFPSDLQIEIFAFNDASEENRAWLLSILPNLPDFRRLLAEKRMSVMKKEKEGQPTLEAVGC